MINTILICSNNYPPKFIGGAELIAHYHAKELQKLNKKVFVYTGTVNPFKLRHSLRKKDYDDVCVYRVCLTAKDYSHNFVNFYNKKIDKHFEQIIQKIKPDVIHIHNITGLSLGMIHIAKKHNIKTVFTLHDNWGICFKNTLIKNENEICTNYNDCNNCLRFIQNDNFQNFPIKLRKDYFKYILKYVDLFICPSKYIADTYIKAGFPKNKFKVIWNGIDVNRFKNIKNYTNTGKINFTFIGYLGAHKGVTTLINAVKHLDNKNIQINIVGDGSEKNNLKKLVKNIGKKAIFKFWGKIDNKHITNVFKVTDILILPSIWPENQPVSITEAMASGIPVIASNMGGIPELIEHGKMGFLFEAGNEKDLALKMQYFIENKNAIKIMGKNAKEKISNYTFTNQVNQILKSYNKKTQNNDKITEELKVLCIGRTMNKICINLIESIDDANIKVNFIYEDWITEDEIKNFHICWIVDQDMKLNIDFIRKYKNLPMVIHKNNLKINTKLLHNENIKYNTYETETEAFEKIVKFSKKYSQEKIQV